MSHEGLTIIFMSLILIGFSMCMGGYFFGKGIHSDSYGIVTNISDADKNYCAIEVEDGLGAFKYRKVYAQCDKYSVGDTVYLTLNVK